MSKVWAGPLQGVRVIDFTHVLAGPFATQVMADLGAEVIKIESPQGGDMTRAFPPFKEGESHYFLGMNHDKKSVVLDLKSEHGISLAKRLIDKSDVVVENFRPGVMAEFGLSYEELMRSNDKLIYCSISGFGQTGPLKNKPSFDVVTQALSGAMSVNGERGGSATKMGLPIGDLVGGVFAPVAIASALYERQQTGSGRAIDISLLDGLMGMLGYLPQLSWFEGQSPAPMGSSHLNIVPYGTFPTSDGEIVIACLSDRFWRKLCECLNLQEMLADPDLQKMSGRKLQRERVDLAISKVTKNFTTTELQQQLDKLDVPNAPVLGVAEALAQEHAIARNMVEQVEHKSLGEMPVVGRPIKFQGQQQKPIKAPPTLGQNTVEVLTELLDLTPDQVAKLQDSGVLG